MVLFKNKATSLETQKHTKQIEIHQSQITNHGLLFPRRFAKMLRQESEESAPSSIQIVIDVAEKTQNPKTFLASQVGYYPKNSCKSIDNLNATWIL